MLIAAWLEAMIAYLSYPGGGAPGCVWAPGRGGGGYDGPRGVLLTLGVDDLQFARTQLGENLFAYCTDLKGYKYKNYDDELLLS